MPVITGSKPDAHHRRACRRRSVFSSTAKLGTQSICAQTPQTPLGIFILDDGVGLVAKRIEIIPNTTPQMLRISSENSAYSSYQRRIDEVHIIGRVIWFARRL